MTILYHIVPRAEWEAALASGSVTPVSFHAAQGILLARAEQYPHLANALFRGRRDLTLLFIDESRLSGAVSSVEISGIPLVRLNAPLPLQAVFETADAPVGDDGRFVSHHETRALATRSDDTLPDIQAHALAIMAWFDRPWWVAGGWAIDTFLGIKTRPHADLEIAILADDQPALYHYLCEWDLRVAAPGAAFVPWNGQPLTAPYHQIWARRSDTPATTPEAFSADPTMLDILIEDHAGAQWQYRRDQRIARPIDAFGAIRDGVPFVRPEIALLFKSKAPRYKDTRDFARVAPLLEPPEREWLRTALRMAHPASPWLALL